MKTVIQVIYWSDLNIVMKTLTGDTSVRLCARAAGLLYSLCLFEFGDGSMAKPMSTFTLEIQREKPKYTATCYREVQYAILPGANDDCPCVLHTFTHDNKALIRWGDLTSDQELFMQRLLFIPTSTTLHTYLSQVGEPLTFWVRLRGVQHHE